MSKKRFDVMCVICFFVLIFGTAISDRQISDTAEFRESPALSSIVVQDISTGEMRTLRPQFNRDEIISCLDLQKDAEQDTLYAAYYVSIFYEDNTNVYYTVRKEDDGYEFFQELFTPDYEYEFVSRK